MKTNIYRLKENREMVDGLIINIDQDLLMISKENDDFFLETTFENGDKLYFWANISELNFIEEKEFEFTEQEKQERELIINGKFLNLN